MNPLGGGCLAFPAGLGPSVRHQVTNELARGLELLPGGGVFGGYQLLAQEIALGPLIAIGRQSQPLQAALEIGVDGRRGGGAVLRDGRERRDTGLQGIGHGRPSIPG